MGCRWDGSYWIWIETKQLLHCSTSSTEMKRYDENGVAGKVVFVRVVAVVGSFGVRGVCVCMIACVCCMNDCVCSCRAVRVCVCESAICDVMRWWARVSSECESRGVCDGQMFAARGSALLVLSSHGVANRLACAITSVRKLINAFQSRFQLPVRVVYI